MLLLGFFFALWEVKQGSLLFPFPFSFDLSDLDPGRGEGILASSSSSCVFRSFFVI